MNSNEMCVLLHIKGSSKAHNLPNQSSKPRSFRKPRTRKAAKFKTEIYRLVGQSNSPRNHHLTIFFLFPCYLYSTWKPNTTDNPSIRSDKGKAPETSKQIVSHCLTAFSSISEFRLTVLASIFSYSTLYGTVPYRIDLNLYCTQPTVVRVLNKSPNLGNAQYSRFLLFDCTYNGATVESS